MQSEQKMYTVSWYFPSKHDYSRVIILNLKKKRLQSGLTQSELAKKAHCSKNSISSYERGDYMPTLISLCDIAKALKCDVSELFTYYKYDS